MSWSLAGIVYSFQSWTSLRPPSQKERFLRGKGGTQEDGNKKKLRSCSHSHIKCVCVSLCTHPHQISSLSAREQAAVLSADSLPPCSWLLFSVIHSTLQTPHSQAQACTTHAIRRRKIFISDSKSTCYFERLWQVFSHERQRGTSVKIIQSRGCLRLAVRWFGASTKPASFNWKSKGTHTGLDKVSLQRGKKACL